MSDVMARELEKYLARGGVLGDVPDGPRLERFQALELAQALESEVARASIAGMSKVRADMGLEDAVALAAFLRRAVSAGV